MYQRKKNRNQRALKEETLISFLKTISSFKKKVHLQNVVEKIQSKNTILRKDRINNTLYFLQKDSYIKLERGIYPKLQTKGYLYLEMISQKQKKYWDKRFRVVSTDNIKTTTNNKTYLRSKLKKYGFLQFTRGLWIYPYPCDTLLQLLSIEYGLKTSLVHFTAQDNETLSLARKYFRLH